MTRDQATATLAELRRVMPVTPVRGVLRNFTDLQCLAGSPWTDPYAVLAAVYALTSCFPYGHRVHGQWANVMTRLPVALASRTTFSEWCIDAHNAINHVRGLPMLSIEEGLAERPLALYASTSGGGMGDTVVALYAACGLAKATGRRVIYYARWREWIGRASFPNVEVRDHRELGHDVSGGWDGPWGYFMATHTAKSRLWAYCANLAAAYGLPAFDGVRPGVDRRIRRQRADGRYAVLAPFTSAWPAREWPAERWTVVANELASAGIRPIGVGSPNQADSLNSTLPGHEYRYGCSPAEVIDLMLGAAVVVGNDSGIAHVGGLLGVPTVCVHAGSLPHDYLFATAPSVTSVVNPDGRYRGDADQPALQAIEPWAVLRTIEDVLRRAGEGRPTGDRTAVEAASIDI